MQPKLTFKIVTVKKPSSGHFLMIERTWRQLKNQFIIALEQTHKPAFVNGRSYICAMIFFSRSYLKNVKIIAGTPTLVKANQYWHKTHLQLFYRELKIFLSDHKIAGTNADTQTQNSDLANRFNMTILSKHYYKT